ncbi:MAG TPA: Yip1 family protein [Stellaceae bacterium]|nr:Yip1 family protein [Stellaceae bacterium]
MGLIARAKNILTAPKREWSVIAGESTGTAALFAGYVAPLAAIPPVAAIIGNLLSNDAMTLGQDIAIGIVSFVIALAGVYVLGLIASKIAPSFGGQDDLGQGLKLVAYSDTAWWIAGALNVIRPLAAFSWIPGLYSLYLLYAGSSVMLSVPRQRSAGYTAVVILVAIGLYIVIAVLIGLVIAAVSLAG